MRPKCKEIQQGKYQQQKRMVALPVYLSPGEEKKIANKQLEIDS